MRSVKVALAWVVGGMTAGSAWGVRRPLTEDLLCRDDMIFIGTIVDREYLPAENIPSVPVMTRVHMEVEETIHGAPPPVIVFDIPGGVIENMIIESDETPRTDIGRRYVIAGILPPFAHSQQGPDMVVLRHWEVNPRGFLPPSEELQSIWAEHCGGSTSGTRPTQKYLSIIPPQLLARCKHYPELRSPVGVAPEQKP